eukprot:CCRYP_007214-RA/>CCRYP_007214-RA protein AED:0.42 eAED:0.42 QI:0/-1/0/1/-1/1/1/0/663
MNQSKATTAPRSPLVLQLKEATCSVNEISTPITETECLSENHELELDDFAQFIAASWDEDTPNAEEEKSILAWNRMKSLVPSAFLQPKSNNESVSNPNDGNKKNASGFESGIDTSSRLDNISSRFRDPIGAVDRDIEEDDTKGPESIEIPYDNFVPVFTEERTIYRSETEAHSDAAGKMIFGEAEAPKSKKEFEVRQVKVSIKIKELNGITRIYSRKKINFLGASSKHHIRGDNNTITAVVTYRDETIDGNDHVTMHSTSLPLSCGSDNGINKRNQTKAYAKWQDEEADGCNVGKSKSEPTSGISFRRTLTRPLIADDIEVNAAASFQKTSVANQEDGLENHRVKERAFLFPSGLKPCANEGVTLQVGLERRPDETISLGVATAIIPWDYQTVEFDIPVMSHDTNVTTKKKKLFALGSSKYVSFPSYALTKYKIDEHATLCVRMVIGPGESRSDQLLIPDIGTNATHVGQIKASTHLSQRDESAPKKNDMEIVKCGSLTSVSSSKMSYELQGKQHSVADLEVINPSTPISLGDFNPESETDENESFTDASSVPLSNLLVPSEMEDDVHLSEISDSDSSSRSIARSLYSAFSSNRRNDASMTEKMIKFITCHSTSFFQRNDNDAEKGEESSDMSSSSVSWSSGSTSLSSSVYEERDVKFDVDVN